MEPPKITRELVALQLAVTRASLEFARLRESALALLSWNEMASRFLAEHGDAFGVFLEQNVPDASLREDVLGDKYDHASLLADWAWCRLVDALNYYMREVVELALVREPERLGTNGSVPLAEVLGCRTMEEFVLHRVRLAAHAKARDDFKLLEYANDDLGLPVFRDDGERRIFEWAIQTRHCLVHNRGLANERLCACEFSGSLEPGTPIELPLVAVPRLSGAILEMSKRVGDSFGKLPE